MPRYFFDVRNGHIRLVDPQGLDCRDDRAATAQAMAIAAQIAQDVPAIAETRRVAVLNRSREEIGEVSVLPGGNLCFSRGDA